MRILTPLGFGLALLAMLGMRRAGTFAASISERETLSLSDADEFAAVSRDLDWFLVVSGLVVGAATLVSGSLRQALAARNDGRELLPAIGVFAYCAFGSMLIAAVYVPA